MILHWQGATNYCIGKPQSIYMKLLLDGISMKKHLFSFFRGSVE